jgi:hypothetical protein
MSYEDYEGTGYKTALVVGPIVFICSWIYAISRWGWFLGIAFGWIPSLIIGFIALIISRFLWPLVHLILIFGVTFVIYIMLHASHGGGY